MTVLNHVKASSVTRTLNIIGDRWIIIILRDAFLGVNRFRDWQSKNNIARSILTNRLKKLVDVGCFTKVLYQERPDRYEYQLTKMGRGLYSAAVLIWDWEDKCVASGGDIPVTLFHKICGHSTRPIVRCDVCNGEVTIHNISFKDGPGVGYEQQIAPRHQRRSRISTKNKEGVMMMEPAADIIGDRWSNLILSAAYLGTRRFDDFQQELKIASNILSNRLIHLVENGILKKCIYSKKPSRYEYRLTEKGCALFPAMVAMMSWGDDWLCEEQGAPFILIHNECQHDTHPKVKCSYCNESLISSEVEFIFD